jgi:hypothetical protein
MEKQSSEEIACALYLNFDMKSLSDKIEAMCLKWVYPTCLQVWKDPPVWSDVVVKAFHEWIERLPEFNIDLKRVYHNRILARFCEGRFSLLIKEGMDERIDQAVFHNWNHFMNVLLSRIYSLESEKGDRDMSLESVVGTFDVDDSDDQPPEYVIGPEQPSESESIGWGTP